MSVYLKHLFGHAALLLASCSLAILPAWAGEAASSEKRAEVGRLVVVGDSLSAGFQNFSLYDSDNVAPPGGQTHGFAELIAQQANVSLNLPLIQYPGIPPVLSLGPNNTVTRGTAIGLREPQTLPVQTFNLSVPGFTVSDSLYRSVNVANLLQNPTAANPEDLLTVEVLGFPSLTPGATPCGVFPLPNGDVIFSAAACAFQLRPNTILISVGNDDVLQTLTSGIAPTDLATFADRYALLLGFSVSLTLGSSYRTSLMSQRCRFCCRFRISRPGAVCHPPERVQKTISFRTFRIQLRPRSTSVPITSSAPLL